MGYLMLFMIFMFFSDRVCSALFLCVFLTDVLTVGRSATVFEPQCGLPMP